ALHRADELGGEREVAEVVGADLELESVGGLAPGRRHHPRVVDQEIEAVVGGAKALGERPHRIQAAEIELLQLHAALGRDRLDLAPGGLAFLHVPAGDHHPGALAGQLAGRDQAHSAVGAGDDRGAARLVGNLLGGPLRAHAGIPLIDVWDSPSGQGRRWWKKDTVARQWRSPARRSCFRPRWYGQPTPPTPGMRGRAAT